MMTFKEQLTQYVPDIISGPQAAKLCGVPYRTVQNWIYLGQEPSPIVQRVVLDALKKEAKKQAK